MNDQNKKASPFDVFLVISNIFLVYWVSINWIFILIFFINRFVPDMADFSFFQEFYSAGVKWSLSLMVVLFPLYLYISKFLVKDIDRNPEKAQIGVRRWLSYLTIFNSAAAIILDVIFLIYNFLNGELTLRFVLKVLAVLIVSLIVFWWLRYDIKRVPGEFSQFAKGMSWLSIILITLSIVFAFVLVGSPGSARKEKFDEARVADLGNIEWEVVNYWQRKSVLPANLSLLNDSISGFSVPNDPETLAPYQYEVLTPFDFNLCANFSLASKKNSTTNFNYRNENWNHEAGTHCFKKHIDPDLYKTKN